MTDANTLEATLKNQQWVGGQAPTNADTEAFEAIKNENLNAGSHPHTFAWFCLVSKFTDAVRKTWGAAAPAKAGKGGKKAAPKTEAKADDDDMDLFGDDNEEDAAAAKVAAENAQKSKKVKKVVIAQSLVLFEVKPVSDETDIDEMAKRILAIEMDGLFWKTEYRKDPVAFGIFKLVIGVTV
jgi:elongation factor 1-beta